MTATTMVQRQAKHDQRLTWLRAHPELLTRLPGANDNVERDHSEALDIALRGMKLERLYTMRSLAEQTRSSIRLLVSEIRGETVVGLAAQFKR